MRQSARADWPRVLGRQFVSDLLLVPSLREQQAAAVRLSSLGTPRTHEEREIPLLKLARDKLLEFKRNYLQGAPLPRRSPLPPSAARRRHIMRLHSAAAAPCARLTHLSSPAPPPLLVILPSHPDLSLLASLSTPPRTHTRRAVGREQTSRHSRWRSTSSRWRPSLLCRLAASCQTLACRARASLVVPCALGDECEARRRTSACSSRSRRSMTPSPSMPRPHAHALAPTLTPTPAPAPALSRSRSAVSPLSSVARMQAARGSQQTSRRVRACVPARPALRRQLAPI